MRTRSDLDWFAARLSIAVYDTNAEYRAMSIQTFREALKHLPGGSQITMRYGRGGATQIFMIGEDEVELGPDATAADIEAALEHKKKLQHSTTPLQQLRKSQA